MRTRALAIARWSLLVWGALSLAGIIGIVAFAALSFLRGDQIDSASASDVRFVLNWCGLGDERIEQVVHSHVSVRSLTGDHLDAYAIKISHVELAELTADDFGFGWYRGDRLPKVLDEAVGWVGIWHGELPPWFPSEAELRSSKMYVYSWSIQYHGTQPSAAELIFVRPSDTMVFYFGGKT